MSQIAGTTRLRCPAGGRRLPVRGPACHNHAMKRLGSAALISLLASLSMVACENGSRLDSSVKNAPQKD
ncbi:MAG TPA: hypothetical protein VF516_28355, partial [Kofleriaceae bacterium]